MKSSQLVTMVIKVTSFGNAQQTFTVGYFVFSVYGGGGTPYIFIYKERVHLILTMDLA